MCIIAQPGLEIFELINIIKKNQARLDEPWSRRKWQQWNETDLNFSKVLPPAVSVGILVSSSLSFLLLVHIGVFVPKRRS